jgi:hypothetical protein
VPYGWRLVLLSLVAFGLASASPSASALAAKPLTTLTFDELPFQPVNGLSFRGVTFGFEVGGVPSTDADYHSFGPGQITFVQDPSLEGDARGVLTLEFDKHTKVLEFGVALSCFRCTLTPGFSVELFNPGGHSRGVSTMDTHALVSFTEAQFSCAGPPVGRAVSTFNSAAAARFALDNLTFEGRKNDAQARAPGSSSTFSAWPKDGGEGARVIAH